MNNALVPLGDRIDLWADVTSAAVWRASWQGAIAVGLVWLVCLTWRRLSPRWQCWLWRLAVVKFALALVWAAPLELPLLTPPAPVEVVEVDAAPTYTPPPLPPVMPPLEMTPVVESIETLTPPPQPIAWRPRGVVIALA
jgi:bla regulator protein BlaR1